MRCFLNTDCTDYTDAFYGDVDIPWSSVVRRGSEHGLHGLHGCFLRTWIFLCVPCLNWDCADSLGREGNGVRASWPLPSLASEQAEESLGVRWVYSLLCVNFV